MPGPLENAKHEQFCQGVARGSSHSDAVRAAGFKTNSPWQQGNLLLLRQDVCDRIAEIKVEIGRNPLVSDAGVPVVAEKPTREWIVQQYMLAIRMAREREDRGNMIKGLDSVAKLEGLMIDRQEVRQGPIDALTPDQLGALVEWATEAKRRKQQPKIAKEVVVPAVVVAPAEPIAAEDGEP